MSAGAERLPRSALVWSEEFDGPAGAPPDLAVWQLETGGGGWGNEELQYYTGGIENACLDGASHLAIVARRPDRRSRNERYGGCAFTSARLNSKNRVEFRYGLVQARIKVPEGCGIWPAFWMLGSDIGEVGWPRCGEIDVMELLGQNPEVLYGAAHGPGYTAEAGTVSHRSRASLADDFHVYSVAWEPGRIRWYLDDVRYGTMTPADLPGRPWAFDHDFFLVLNVAVGGSWPGRPSRSVVFPQTMLVDYVRLYAPGST